MGSCRTRPRLHDAFECSHVILKAMRILLATLVLALGLAGPAFGAIEGTDLADFLVGTPGPDEIAAKGGDDVVYGLGGADRIDGGAGVCVEAKR